MLIKPNWDNFKAKFSENPQDNFEWFCYLLFSKEYNQPYGTHRYKNQSGIETDPIELGDEIIGWQSKFYEDTLSNHKEDLLGTLIKTKRDNPNITKIILYTNSEWGQGQGTKEPKAKIETEEKAKELNIELIWRTRSYFESPFVCQEQKNISGYFFELDSKWELTAYGFLDTIKLKYLNDFKTISLLVTDKKLIDDIFVNLAIIKGQKEEKNNEKFINREDCLCNYQEIHNPKEPIKIKELIKISKKSLIYGKAGIGKTTLCKYIAYMWAKEELYSEFEYLIYIPLREWENNGIKGAIRDYYYSHDVKELKISFDANKTFFLFDGYDELNAEKKKLLRNEIEKYSLTYYIITTRPYGYQKRDFRVDEYFETVGFTDEDVISYINNFFGKDSEISNRLKAYLEINISIKHISYIPLMLEMICSLWKQKAFGSDMTMTELYRQVIENFLEKHSQDERVYEWENREEIKELLGKIAFEGLTKQTILFDGKLILDTIGKENLDFFKESIINSGFLKSDRKDKSLLGNNFEFPHLTFQEYFSALYISMLSKEEQSKIIRDWKFYPHMQIFFSFLGGLIEDKEFLLREIENEPNDIIGHYSLGKIVDIVSEIKRKDLPTDIIFYINKKILQWLIFSIQNLLNYKLILNSLQLVIHILNEKTIEKILQIAIEKEDDNYLQEYIINTFYGLSKIDKKYINYLIPLEKKIEYVNKKSYLQNSNKYVDKVLDEIIKKLDELDIWNFMIINTFEKNIAGIHNQIILEKEIRKILKKYQIYNISKWYIENKDYITDSILMYNTYYKSDKEYILHQAKNILVEPTLRSKYQKILEIIDSNDNIIPKLLVIIKNIENENFYWKMKLDIINLLSQLNVEHIDFLNIMIELWLDEDIEDYFRLEALKVISLNLDNNFIDKLVIPYTRNKDSLSECMEEALIIKLAKLSKNNPYVFELVMDITYDEKNESLDDYFLFFYIKSLEISIIFEAYDKGWESIGGFFFHNMMYDFKPLYIKNKKLHTIENGKEISTQREVDDATLNEIKMLLREEGLDDKL